MSCRVIRLAEEPEFVGRAVCAIGVFDGVHAGHQVLVRDAVALARKHAVEAYVITFDRDPDQVVTPESAAPQLLTLADKARLLCETGADAVLVVPFTEQVATLTPHEFLTDVLLSAVDPVALVVGDDFRFGHRAQGDVETLRRFSEPRGIGVVTHTLIERDGVPVSSTRIRGLVAAGDVAGAAGLLGRPHRVSGTVVRGRGEGTAIGIPTANVAPVEFAALPADGSYAGRVVVDSEMWPAAISVGRAPSFPEATDVIEAHLIGFEGDLYGADVSIEFVQRLRDHSRFETVDDLVSAVHSDIEAAREMVAIAPPKPFTAPADEPDDDADSDADGDDVGDWELNPFAGLAESLLHAMSLDDDDDPDFLDDGTPVVEDPAALEAAERAVAGIEPQDAYAGFDETWVEVLAPMTLGSLMVSGGISAFVLTAPLGAAGIPFVWQPFPPEEQQNVRPDFNYWMRFSLFVPAEYAREAASLLGARPGEDR